MAILKTTVGTQSYIVTVGDREISVRPRDTKTSWSFEKESLVPLGMDRGEPNSEIRYSVDWQQTANNGLGAISATDAHGLHVIRKGSGVDAIPEALLAIDSAASNAANALHFPRDIKERIQNRLNTLGLPTSQIQKQ